MQTAGPNVSKFPGKGSTVNYYNENRWYHVYLQLFTCATILSALFWWLTGSPTAVVITFAIQTFICFAAFLAETLVMGFTANAGGFFWMVITGYLVCEYFAPYAITN